MLEDRVNSMGEGHYQIGGKTWLLASSFWPPYFGKCLHLKGNGLNTSSNIVRVLEKGLQWLMWLCCKGLKIESKTQSWKKWFQTIINKLPSDKKLDPTSIWWWVQISIKA